MDKLQKNIQRLLAIKALNDIDKIVSEENTKQKNQWQWAGFVQLVFILAFVVLAILIMNG